MILHQVWEVFSHSLSSILFCTSLSPLLWSQVTRMLDFMVLSLSLFSFFPIFFLLFRLSLFLLFRLSLIFKFINSSSVVTILLLNY